MINREGKRESNTIVSDKERVINQLQKQISELVQQKGQTQQTLLSSLQDLEKRKISPVKSQSTEKRVVSKAKGLGTQTDPITIGFKNGYYGQIVLPIPDPSVISSFYATASSQTYPVLLSNVFGNLSSYYPTPSDSTHTTKRKVFENAAPFCITKSTPFSQQLTKYFDSDLTSASVSLSYSSDTLNGYISVPIGDTTFMYAT